MSSQQSPESYPESYYLPSSASSAETSPMSNEDIIAQKILKRAEIAKMTRQLKEKLFKAGLKVRDQQNQHSNLNSNSSNSNSSSTTPSSSPSKSLSEDVTNNITATAISNIQNSKLITPTKQNFSFNDSTLSMSSLTPAISPLKRKSSSSIYRSTESNRHLLYEHLDDDLMMSPLKKLNNGLNSSPYAHSTSPYQYTKGSLLQSPPNSSSLSHSRSIASLHPPKTPPQKQVDIFQSVQRMSTIDGSSANLSVLKQNKDEQVEGPQLAPGKSDFSKPKSKNKSKQIQEKTQKPKRTNSRRKQNKINANTNTTNENESKQPKQSKQSQQTKNSSEDLEQEEPDNWNELDEYKGFSQTSLLSTPKASNRIKEFTTPNKNSDDLGADLLLFLSNSPARTFNGKDSKELNKMLAIPTTPRSNGTNLSNMNMNMLESTPLRNQLPQYFTSPSMVNTNTPSAAFLQPLLGTPIGINVSNRFQNPDTPNNNKQNGGLNNKNLTRTPGFSMSDYINFTPSPRVTRTPDYSHAMFTKPMLNNYSKELNIITSIKEDED